VSIRGLATEGERMRGKATARFARQSKAGSGAGSGARSRMLVRRPGEGEQMTRLRRCKARRK